jgi:hydrogenase maturation protein HypF
MTDEIVGCQILVRGIVQGVGFRPFVYSLATELNLTGWVRNSSRGVEIEVYGIESAVSTFVESIRRDTPPLARIDHLESRSCLPNGSSSFEIIHSEPQPGEFLPVSPDVAICPDCQRELFDRNDRRYRYPFINCTNCGPRFTIIHDIPYDRPNTTMADFPLCPDCKAEYDNPLDRRFHAQPVACPVCGPQVWLETKGRKVSAGDDAILAARKWLKDGKILAIKGLGGYHLACDATNPGAVSELRRRKQRSDKPFALMAFSLDEVQHHVILSPVDAGLLQSRQRPIVLLPRQTGSTLTDGVAPNQKSLGFMLAYTPLHLLLLEPQPGFPEILVMTSGNLSEEPIAYEDDEARARLAPLVDAFLMHNRPIHMRTDDSVLCSISGEPYIFRRARGFAPDPLILTKQVPPVLGAGAELKNTFCLTRDQYAFVSHHIGDLENYETLRSFENGIAHFERLFRIQPEIIACDLHPNYLATRYAKERSQRQGLHLVEVQHHHAHLAACLAENGWDSEEPVIGLSFDGTGLGPDGAIWGGEVLLGGYYGYERLYHLKYTPLPGGDQSIRKPARMALAHLWEAGVDWDEDLLSVQALCVEERTILKSMLKHRINSPSTSSMGRLFDAVASILGVRQKVNYEGQAAMELEALADLSESQSYTIELNQDLIDPQPLIVQIVQDWRNGVAVPLISARFHNSLVKLAIDLCCEIRDKQGISTVALSGGVWQNQYLLERSLAQLRKLGFQTLIHQQLPPNDGCISLGQALVAATISS